MQLEARTRFAMDTNHPINMIDLLYQQAQLDDNIDLPEEFDLEDFDDDLSSEDIAALAAG